ncbi:hypothetical protein PMKS-001270 [Pichia membranifaciens]|uniref:Protein phosphatase inhibitor 2 n=1 Tax=Pichia membranifaciens TaxID=4926 RepID=A0A1Q2YE37_9ASCO|nr:hypothetical protein PMKS-001270 [Pichia membranifaciens]
MKIDEPKTPYEGGADGDADQEDAFELGEGLDDADDVKKGQIEVVGGEAPEAPASEVPDAAEPSAEEKHRIFEEKRKQHYHLKAAPLKEHHGLAVDDDEADEDQA